MLVVFVFIVASPRISSVVDVSFSCVSSDLCASGTVGVLFIGFFDVSFVMFSASCFEFWV